MHEIFIDTSQYAIRMKWIAFCEHVFGVDDVLPVSDWEFLDNWLWIHHAARLRSHEHPIRIQFDHIDQMTQFALTWT